MRLSRIRPAEVSVAEFGRVGLIARGVSDRRTQHRQPATRLPIDTGANDKSLAGQIEVGSTAPAHPVGKVHVTVMANGYTSPLTMLDHFTYLGELAEVTVTASDAEAAEARLDTGSYLIHRSGPTSAPLKVAYFMDGDATQGQDYQELEEVVEIPIGSATATVVLRPIDDALLEPSEWAELFIIRDDGYLPGDPAAQPTDTGV